MRLIRLAPGSWSITDLSVVDLATVQLGLVLTGREPLRSEPDPADLAEVLAIERRRQP